MTSSSSRSDGPAVLGSADLATFINEKGIDAEIVYLDQETPTVEMAAQAVGVHPDRIGKSILFLVNGRPQLVIANGATRLNYKRLADYLDVSRRRIKLANAKQVLDILGFPVGAVPPFGHKQKVPVLIEEQIMSHPEIYAGGGASNALVRLKTAELKDLVQAEVVSLR